MPTSEERYKRGMAVRRALAGGAVQVPSRPEAFEVAPDLERWATESLFGDIWARPALDMKTRSLVTMAVLATLGWEAQLRAHIGYALNLGHTRDTIVELFMHLALYAGVPAAVNALAVAKEVFDQRGV